MRERKEIAEEYVLRIGKMAEQLVSVYIRGGRGRGFGKFNLLYDNKAEEDKGDGDGVTCGWEELKRLTDNIGSK